MKASFLCCYKFSFFLFHECVISQSEGSGLVFMSLDGEPSRTTFETLCLIKLAPYPDILMWNLCLAWMNPTLRYSKQSRYFLPKTTSSRFLRPNWEFCITIHSKPKCSVPTLCKALCQAQSEQGNLLTLKYSLFDWEHRTYIWAHKMQSRGMPCNRTMSTALLETGKAQNSHI